MRLHPVSADVLARLDMYAIIHHLERTMMHVITLASG
jgi:hypothetical protein